MRVSTVFLGLDDNFGDGEPSLFESIILGLGDEKPQDSEPLLFESMVFGLKDEEPQVRYSTYEQAEEGHKKLVEEYKSMDKEVDKGGLIDMSG